MPTLVEYHELCVRQGLHIALPAVHWRDFILSAPHNQGWGVHTPQEDGQRLIEHVWFPGNARGHLAVNLPGYQLFDIGFGTIELVHFAWIKEACSNVVGSVEQELVHNLPASRLNPHGAHQHQLLELIVTHGDYLGGDPPAKSQADQGE